MQLSCRFRQRFSVAKNIINWIVPRLDAETDLTYEVVFCFMSADSCVSVCELCARCIVAASH